MSEPIEVKLDFRNKRPISEQLHEEMRRLILGGVLQPGAQLPTVRNLAARLQVNFNTVARVYRILDMEGFIITQQGRGSYVLEDPGAASQTAQLPRQERSAQLIEGLVEQASHMDISPEELLAALQHLIQQARRKTLLAPGTILTAQKKRRVTSSRVKEGRKTSSFKTNPKHRRKMNRSPG